MPPINDTGGHQLDEDLAVAPEVPQALPGRVVLLFEKPKQQTAGGLIIPVLAQRVEKDVATVVSVGDGTDRAEEMFERIVKPGDRVIAKHYYGEPFLVGEGDDAVEYRIFRMFEIIGRLPRE